MVKIIIHQNKQQLREFNSYNPHNQNNQQMISQITSEEKTQKEQALINREQNLNFDQRDEEFNQFEEHNLIQNNRSTFDFGQQEKKKKQQEEDHQKLQKLMEKSFDDQPVKRSRKNKFNQKNISQVEKQNRKAHLKIQKHRWDGFNHKQQQQSTQTSRYAYKESRKPSIREQLIKSPVYGIVAVKDDKFFYHTDSTLVSFVSQSPLVYQRMEIELESKIIGFQVDKANKVIIQTETHTILYSEDFEKLDSFNDEIEKDLLTYTLKHFKFDTLIYFSGQKKKLLKREINNNENTFGKSQILQICSKPVSIKIMKKSQLFLGFSNGLIELYELQQDRIVLQTKYKINQKMEFSSIIFQETYCLGISEKIVFILEYLSKQSQKVLEANENIIQCSHYYNQTKKEYVIHALQQNQKIYSQVLVNGEYQGQERQIQTKVTSVAFQESTLKFIYGCENGNIQQYQIRNI